LCDTIGDELKLNCRAKLSKFGYSEKETNDWCREVETAWRRWAWNPRECDLAGKATITEMLDGVIRSYLIYGEAFGVIDYMLARERRAYYGVETGTKVSLVAPHRCPRVTDLFKGMDQGIIHDNFGRPRFYRFKVYEDGIERTRDIRASDVIHVMDRGENINAPRGISAMAPVLKVIAQSDQLADATLSTALLQTIFAAVIKSPEPSEAAFNAIQTIDDTDAPLGYDAEAWQSLVGNVRADLVEVWSQRIESLKEHSVSITDPSRIAHLGPGEDLNLQTASTPGSNYIPFSQNLQREMARCLGVTFENFAMDHTNATYSSVRMATASIWPVVMRRRTRIAVPFVQAIYERWLEEAITSGRVPFKGGPAAFASDRESVYQAEFMGPSAPSADDYKAAMASKLRLELGIATYADECAALGKNPQEQIVAIGNEIKMMEANKVPHPFGRPQGGDGAGPDGAAADGQRTPKKEKA
jgi:lambda family phage portal protein